MYLHKHSYFLNCTSASFIMLEVMHVELNYVHYYLYIFVFIYDHFTRTNKITIKTHTVFITNLNKFKQFFKA